MTIFGCLRYRNKIDVRKIDSSYMKNGLEICWFVGEGWRKIWNKIEM